MEKKCRKVEGGRPKDMKRQKTTDKNIENAAKRFRKRDKVEKKKEKGG